MPRIRDEGFYFKVWLDRRLVLTVTMFFPPSTLSLCVEPLSNRVSCLWRGNEATFDGSGVYRNTKPRLVLTCLVQVYAPCVNSREMVFECGDDATLLVQWRPR